MPRTTGFSPYTRLANCTGQPSMSVPLHWSEDGLPLGTMFTVRFGDEATLFRLARQLERARPWWGRKPAVFGYPPHFPGRTASAWPSRRIVRF